MAEPLIALAAALLLTAMLTWLSIPISQVLEVELRPASADSVALSPAEIREEVERLGLFDRVELSAIDGADRLVLGGPAGGDEHERSVAELLESAGYQRNEFTRRGVDVAELMQLDVRTVLLLISIQALIFTGAGLLLARGRICPRSPETMASLPRAAVLGVAAGVGAIVLSATLSLVLNFFGLPVEEQDWVIDLLSEPKSLLAIAPWLVLIGPLAEEVFFRGYFFRFTAERAGLPTGLVLSSVMFAAIHGNPSGFLIYLGIGCIFAWVYHHTGRFVSALVAHATLNFSALIIALLVVTPDP